MTDPKIPKPDKDAPMTSASWTPEPPALDMEPEPPTAQNPDTDADDVRQPPARSGGATPDRKPAKADGQTGRVDPESRIAPEVIGDRSG